MNSKKNVASAPYKHLENGVRFECQGSGKCCVSHGEYGHVYLSRKDRIRLARHLVLSVDEFTNQFCTKNDGFWVLKDNEGHPDCLFLKNKKCSVYTARPSQCRTWPFWPDVLSVKNWSKDVASFCPGIGQGKLHTWVEIEKIATDESDHVRRLFAERGPQID